MSAQDTGPETRRETPETRQEAGRPSYADLLRAIDEAHEALRQIDKEPLLHPDMATLLFMRAYAALARVGAGQPREPAKPTEVKPEQVWRYEPGHSVTWVEDLPSLGGFVASLDNGDVVDVSDMLESDDWVCLSAVSAVDSEAAK